MATLVDPDPNPVLDLDPTPTSEPGGLGGGGAVVRSLAVVVALLLVAGVVSAAVVRSEPDAEPMTALAIAASAEKAAAWSTVTVDMTITVSSNGQRLSSSMRLLIDNERRLSSMTAKGAGLPRDGLRLLVTGDAIVGDVGEPSPVIGGHRYVGWRLPEAARTQAWNATAGRQLLDQLSAATGEPQVMGTARIDGVSTTRYRVDIDAAQLAAETAARNEEIGLPGPGSEITRSLPAQMDVWIDGDDLIRRVAFDADVAGATIGSQADFTDYGEPVDIEAPPEADIQFVSSVADVMTMLRSAADYASTRAFGSNALGSAAGAADGQSRPPKVNAS